jgi:gas vesicle protein
MSERGGGGGGGGGGGSGFGGFLLGVAVGAVVGLLFAPETGEGTRHKLSRRLRDLRDAAEEKAEEVRGLLDAEPDEGAEPRSTREELTRRLEAARRRRRRRPGAAEGASEHEEEDEPVA